MIFKSLLFGATLAIAVGPIALLIIRYGIVEGPRAAIASGFGAATCDFTYALIAFTIGALTLSQLSEYETLIRLFSSFVLIGFGAWMLIKSITTTTAPNLSTKRGNAFWTTYILTLVNPLTILIFLGFAGQLSSDGLLDALTLSLCVFLGSFVVQMLYAAGGSYIGSIIKKPNIIRGLNALAGLGIMAFGLVGLIV